MSHLPLHLGVDLSKHQLVVAQARSLSLFEEHVRTFANTPQGLDEFEAWLDVLGPQRVSFEATGGYEKPLQKRLERREDLEACLISPRRSRQMMRGLGQGAKTDRLDAIALARMSTTGAFAPLVPRCAARQELRELMDHRAHLVAERQRIKCRRDKTLSARVQALQEDRLSGLAEELGALEDVIEELVQSQPELAKLCARLEQVPGLARISAWNLLAYVPELGRVDNAKLSALVGLAPQARDSGTSSARRQTGPGRRQVKRTMWLASMHARKVPGWAQFADRLEASGKSKKVVRVALMRKMMCTLNAMVRHDQDFEPQKVESRGAGSA